VDWSTQSNSNRTQYDSTEIRDRITIATAERAAITSTTAVIHDIFFAQWLDRVLSNTTFLQELK
jgi:hypothetical protein